MLATLALVAIWTAIWLWLRDPFMVGAAVLVMLGSLSPFYLPTRYRMADDTISIRTVFGARKKPWDLYRRYQSDRHGVLLSPFDRPSRLDRFHGLNLRFDPEDRTRVLDFIKARLTKA